MNTDYRALCAELADMLEANVQLPAELETESLTLLDRARAALAEPVGEPAPPAAGEEVAELVRWLRQRWPHLAHIPNSDYALGVRAADLLSQRHPAPVPVAERPWERDGWCDEQGRCWWGSPCGYTIGAAWSLREVALRKTWETHCLPATALPLPAGEVQP